MEFLGSHWATFLGVASGAFLVAIVIQVWSIIGMFENVDFYGVKKPKKSKPIITLAMICGMIGMVMTFLAVTGVLSR